MNHSTLGLRVIKKKKVGHLCGGEDELVLLREYIYIYIYIYYI